MNKETRTTRIRRTKCATARKLAQGLLLLACTMACACDPELETEPAPESDKDTGELREIVTRVVHRHIDTYSSRLQGAGVAIVHKDAGLVLYDSFGNFNGEDPFLVASLSKVIDAGMILSLQDKGLIERDQPVKLSCDKSAKTQAFSFEQLLSNSSGLPCPRVAGISEGALCQFDGKTTLSQCAASIMDDPQTTKDTVAPDTDYCYGGRQWQILGAAAEAATGRSWDQLFHDTYVEPCGLLASGFVNQFSDPIAAQLGWGGYPEGVNIQDLSSSNPNIEGGFYTTLSDFSRILLMQLRGGVCNFGRVMSPESADRWLEDRIDLAFGGSVGPGFHPEDIRIFGRGYGLGWWVDRETGRRAVPGAYGSTAWIAPDRSYAAIVATKSNSVVGRAIFEDLRQEIEKKMAAMNQ